MTTFLPLLFSCLQLAFDMEVLKSITVQVGLPKRLSEKLKKSISQNAMIKLLKLQKMITSRLWKFTRKRGKKGEEKHISEIMLKTISDLRKNNLDTQ